MDSRDEGKMSMDTQSGREYINEGTDEQMVINSIHFSVRKCKIYCPIGCTVQDLKELLYCKVGNVRWGFIFAICAIC